MPCDRRKEDSAWKITHRISSAQTGGDLNQNSDERQDFLLGNCQILHRPGG